MKLNRILIPFSLVLLIATTCHPAQEFGPVSGGLRMRLEVTPLWEQTNEGFRVRINLLNTSKQDITIRPRWTQPSSYQPQPGMQAYIEAALSIESFPPLAPWRGQVGSGHPSTEEQSVLKPGQPLSVEWNATGMRLKNKNPNPLESHNPEFIVAGLYSVHALLALTVDERPIVLRSKEQFVSIGGSQAMPRHTYGEIINVDSKKKTASLKLGSAQGVELGDHFQVERSYFVDTWELVITQVGNDFSNGRLELFDTKGEDYVPRFPADGVHATLVLKK